MGGSAGRMVHTVFRDDDAWMYQAQLPLAPTILPPEDARSGAVGLGLLWGPGRIWPPRGKQENLAHLQTCDACRRLPAASGICCLSEGY